MKKLTADSPETKSENLVALNIAALQALFPEAVSEGKIRFEVLKELLGEAVDDADEKYGMNWHGKRRARQMSLTPSTGTLLPNVTDSLEWSTTQNILIEGDNLEVLKLLQKSYSGKVKIIYIDPPYNRGKDFVYPDDFTDNIGNYLSLTGQVDYQGKKITSNTEASGRFHTGWLNMIFPRLKAAKSLMRRDGIIMISIDDQELANLRFVCDDVFGAENFVACLVWEKGRKNDAKLFSLGHEYLVIYANSLSFLNEQRVKWREEKPGAREIWEKYLELRATHGANDKAIEAKLQSWYSDLPRSHPSKKWSRYKRVDKNGPWRDRDISWPGGGGPKYEVVHPKTKLPCAIPEAGWRYSTSKEMERQIALGLVEFREDHTEPPFRKAHIKPLPEEIDEPLDEDEDQIENDETGEEEFATQVRGTYFYKQSQVTVKSLRALMGTQIFNNPKDCEEIRRLIEYTSGGDPDAIVMDFFAGSGTTGQAVWELNAKDNGGRRFILVQLPEPLDPAKKEQKLAAEFCDKLGKPRHIAELTKERLRRASKKIGTDHPNYEGDAGFRVFKLASSNIRAWEADPANLEASLLTHAEHLVQGRSEQDVLYELLLKLGLDLCVPIEMRTIAGKAVHSIGGGALIVCLADGLTMPVVEPLSAGIVAWRDELAPAVDTRVVFKDAGFADDVAKTNMASILSQHGLTDVRSL